MHTYTDYTYFRRRCSSHCFTYYGTLSTQLPRAYYTCLVYLPRILTTGVLTTTQVLHLMPHAVQTAYDDPTYTDPVRGGPLRLLSERTASCRELWQQLVGYSKETEPLAVLAAAQPPQYVKLYEHLQDHHAALLLANSPGEELVKGAKNTSAQQAAHPTGAEVKLKNYFSTVWENGMWGAPTLEWLADTRCERRETATAAAKARKEQRATPPSEPLPPVQLVDGLGDAETSGDEDEDLLAEVTGSSEDGRSDDSDVEEDDDGGGDRPIPRNELVADKVCWCWDADLPKAPYTSKQAP